MNRALKRRWYCGPRLCRRLCQQQYCASESGRNNDLDRWLRHALFEANLVNAVDEYLEAPFEMKMSPPPHSVAFDSKQEELFVLFVNHIEVFDSRHNLLRTIGSKGSGDAQFNDAYGLYVDSESSLLLVADSGNRRVQVLGTDGTFIRSFGSNKLKAPTCVVMHPVSHQIFVCDYGNRCVQVFSEDGAFQYQFGSEGCAAGQLLGPYHLAIDIDKEEIFVAEDGNDRVSVFSIAKAASGTFLRSFGSEGSGPNQLNGPRGIAFRSLTSEIIVADTDNHRLQVFDRQGTFLRSFGSQGRGDNQFSFPYGVCVHGVAGHIAVADLCNYRVLVLPPGSV